jgi:hypothetical protein
MRRNLRRRFWAEAIAATVTGVLTIVTLISREWIEVVFGVEPDGGDGSLEWLIVVGCLVVTGALALLARREWHLAQERT